MWFSSNKTDQPKTKENCNEAKPKTHKAEIKKVKSESKDNKMSAFLLARLKLK